jgi:acyl-CoA thioesterase FadM
VRVFEAAYRVRFDEAGPDGLLRPSGVVRYLQDLAWQHSEAAGYDRAWYRARGLIWVVRAVDLTLVGGVAYGETARASTEVTGWRRVWARRESEVRRADGGLIARASIDWVLLGESGRPTRVPPDIEAFADPGATFAPLRLDLPAVPAGSAVHRVRVRPQDLDPMGHVNNATYLDYVDEALAAVGGPAAFTGAAPRRVRLVYLGPALPGSELVCACWPLADGWACRMSDGSGVELVRGLVSAS